MKLTGFEIFALLLCSCLSGIILSAYNMTALVTDRELALVFALYTIVIMMLGARLHYHNALDKHLSAPKKEIEDRQALDLQGAHRRRVLALKNENQVEVNRLQGLLHAANAKFDRLNFEYEWMSNTYQDQMRSLQEQEDRLDYLERKLQEFGQLTPTSRQPFSAPPSRIQFASPPRRSFAAGAPSPLSQVMKAGEIEVGKKEKRKDGEIEFGWNDKPRDDN